MYRLARLTMGFFLAGLLVVGPLAYHRFQETRWRNFRVVYKGVLYRCGQLSPVGFKNVLSEYGIRTVISLRENSAEEDYCQDRGVKFVFIPPKAWWAPDGTVPAAECVQRFLKIMEDKTNHPVLVHCYAGSHRTGAYCAVYRMEFDGWSNAQAIAEMKDLGYSAIDDEWDILDFLSHYQPGRGE